MVQLKVTLVPLSTVVLDSEVRRLVLVGGSTRRKLTGFCMKHSMKKVEHEVVVCALIRHIKE